jgi:hypothetical protein
MIRIGHESLPRGQEHCFSRAVPVGALPRNLRLVIHILWQEATRAATADQGCIDPEAGGSGLEAVGTGLEAAGTGPAAGDTPSSAAGRHKGCRREAEGPAGSCIPLAPFRRWPSSWVYDFTRHKKKLLVACRCKGVGSCSGVRRMQSILTSLRNTPLFSKTCLLDLVDIPQKCSKCGAKRQLFGFGAKKGNESAAHGCMRFQFFIAHELSAGFRVPWPRSVNRSC